METKNYMGFDSVIIGDTLRKLREKKKMTQMEIQSLDSVRKMRLR